MNIEFKDIEALITIGSQNRFNELDLLNFKSKSYLNCLTIDLWQQATISCNDSDLINVLKGFILVGRSIGWQGGSVDGAIWIYRLIQRKGLDPDYSIADWALKNSSNEYVPFGSSYYGERNIEAYFTFQEEKKKKKAKSYTDQSELLARVQGRKERRKKAIAELRKLSSIERGKILSELLEKHANDLVQAKLEIIAADTTYPPEYYPNEWIELTEDEIAQLPIELKRRLFDKLSVMTKGKWKHFAAILQKFDDAS